MINFRGKSDLQNRIMHDTNEKLLSIRVQDFGNSVIFEDLQYSTTMLKDKIQYSVFILYSEKK